MVDKIMGSESEIWVGSVESVHGRLNPPCDYLFTVLRNSDLHYVGEFVINGSRIYKDMSFFFECSTAEERKPHRVVIREKANEWIADWARKAAEKERGFKLDVTKNNTDAYGHIFGCHENYLINRDITVNGFSTLLKKYVPHLLSRIVYTGAGDVWKDVYVMSPRAMVTEAMVSASTTSQRAFINTRDESHTEYTKYYRLHGILPDALMNEVAGFLKYFTTSAILTEIERGNFEDAPILLDPISNFQNLSKHASDKPLDSSEWVVQLDGGRKMNVIDLQKYYLHKISEKTIEDEWDEKGMKLWQDTLDRLENNSFDSLEKRIDWLMKKRCIREQIDAHKEIPTRKVAYVVSQQYHELDARRSFFYEKQQDGLTERLFSPNDIMHAVYYPPEDTRARLRVSFSPDTVSSVDWGGIILRKPGVDSKLEIKLNDPYKSRWA